MRERGKSGKVWQNLDVKAAVTNAIYDVLIAVKGKDEKSRCHLFS